MTKVNNNVNVAQRPKSLRIMKKSIVSSPIITRKEKKTTRSFKEISHDENGVFNMVYDSVTIEREDGRYGPVFLKSSHEIILFHGFMIFFEKSKDYIKFIFTTKNLLDDYQKLLKIGIHDVDIDPNDNLDAIANQITDTLMSITFSKYSQCFVSNKEIVVSKKNFETKPCSECHEMTITKMPCGHHMCVICWDNFDTNEGKGCKRRNCKTIASEVFDGLCPCCKQLE
jgi:hypothetical protein